MNPGRFHSLSGVVRNLVVAITLACIFAGTCTSCPRLLAQDDGSRESTESPETNTQQAPPEEETSGLRPQQPTNPQPAIETGPSSVIEGLKANITARTTQLENSDKPPETREALAALYNQALNDLGVAQENEKSRLENLRKAQAAPQKIADLKTKLKEDSDQRSASDVGRPTLDEAEQLLAQLKSQLSTANANRTTIDTTIASRRARRDNLPTLIAEARPTGEVAPSNPADADPIVKEANEFAFNAKRIAATEQAQLLESEMLLYDAESALLPLQLEEANATIQNLQAQLNSVESILADQRQLRINAYVSKFQNLSAPKEEAYDKIRHWLNLADVSAKQAGARKDDLQLTWRQLSKRMAEVGVELQDTEETLEYWRGVERNMQSQMSSRAELGQLAASKRWVVEILRKQRDKLPDLELLNANLKQYQNDLQAVRSLEYDLSEVDRLLEQDSVDKQSQLFIVSSEIVDEMKEQSGSYITELAKLAGRTAETHQFVKRYRDFIDKQLLWIPNAEPLGLRNMRFAADAFRWLVRVENWTATGAALAMDFRTYWALYCLIFLGMALLLFKQAEIRRRLVELSNKAERSSCTRFRLSAECLLLTLLIAVPLPLLLLFLTWRLNAACENAQASVPFIRALAGGCLIAALTWFPMELLRQVCRPVGLGIQHFGWQESNAKLLRSNLRWLIDFSVPLAGLVGMFDFQPNSLWEDSFGRACFILLMPIVSVFFARVMSPSSGIFKKFLSTHKDGWVDQLSVLWYPATILVPVASGILSFSGYHYTSQQLALRLIATLWVAVLFAVAYCLLGRWLVLKRRKLMVAQARLRLEKAAQRDKVDSEVATQSKGEEQLNLVAIDQQTKRLLVSICVVGSLVFTFMIWSDVLPAISLLDNVVLWTVTGEEPDSSVPITLSSLVQVVPIIILATVAARNLPGLLEIAFLQHLPLSNAARYAISTLASYAIAAIGIMSAASVLGLRWGNIQWIVAGLGVGLGFGLQEIFANFISGIILLFEQPIRVGDVVTIDETTGTVARIRIRATTIVNWDRQELIVPNKELITGKLINWTLSDSTNRVVVNVGVAYGSDTDEACEILRKVCAQQTNLMRDPEPMITFEGFGDNTLNLVLRTYLESLDNRLSTIHTLHAAIYKAFNEAGIEISFPQRDLHLRSLPQSLTDWLRSKD